MLWAGPISLCVYVCMSVCKNGNRTKAPSFRRLEIALSRHTLAEHFIDNSHFETFPENTVSQLALQIRFSRRIVDQSTGIVRTHFHCNGPNYNSAAT